MAKKSDNTLLYLGLAAGTVALIASKKPNAAVGNLPYLQNFHVLKITFLGPTDNAPSRVKIESERFQQSKIINLNYKFDTPVENAQNYLEQKGFKLIGKGEGKNCSYIISETFEPIK